MTTFLAQEALGIGFEPLFFFYEALGDVTDRAFSVLMVFAFLFAFAGLLSAAFKAIAGGDILAVFKQVLVTGIVVSIIPFVPDWVLATQATLGVDLLVALEVDPWSVIENAVLEAVDFIDFSGSVTAGILGIFNPLEIFGTIAGLVGSFILLCVTIVAFALMYLAFQIQIVAIYIAIAASPIFLGMLLFEQTRETGTKYISGIFGICFWPLGWGLGLLFADAFIDAGEEILTAVGFFSALIDVITFGTLTYSISVIVILIALVWIIVTVFIAPKVVSKAVTAGTQIGLGMVGGAIGVGSSAAGAAIGAATTAATAAAGIAATVATGGGAAPVAIGATGAAAGAAGSVAGGAVSGAGGIVKGMTDE